MDIELPVAQLKSVHENGETEVFVIVDNEVVAKLPVIFASFGGNVQEKATINLTTYAEAAYFKSQIPDEKIDKANDELAELLSKKESIFNPLA